MNYKEITDTYQKIEATTKRLEIIDFLVSLIKKIPSDLIGKVIYLTQGKLYPDYEGVEIGMAEKLVIRSLVIATKKNDEEVNKVLNRVGDLGHVAHELLPKKETSKLPVIYVYEILDKIAKKYGEGSVAEKVNLLADILAKATAEEGKYIIRTITGKLRLGMADMTMIDALSIVYGGGKQNRHIVERSYNITSDLGMIAERIAKRGLKSVEKINVMVGKPIRPMLAERLSDPNEILQKLNGEAAIEYKYDGERIQIHKNGDKIALFSRRLENTTHQFPDLVEFVKKNIKAKTVIMEGEAVAVNLNTGELRPFQDLMRRRRKHEITKTIEDYPIVIFLFDILFLNGKDLTKTSLPQRRKALEKIVNETEQIRLSYYKEVKDAKEIEEFFEISVEEGLEGLMCKSTAEDSFYKAGARGWQWIKYKRDYKSEMTDTADLVVVGALHGRGRRAAFYGSLLLAIYDKKTDTFKTITKLGSGFTDVDLAKLPKILKPYEISHIHPRVDSIMKADQWFTPGLVLEVIGAELTLSPIHKAAWGKLKKDAGIAIRFPRFTGKYRDDKAPEDATETKEIVEMYKSRIKSIKKK